jgi:hypothetical protein
MTEYKVKTAKKLFYDRVNLKPNRTKADYLEGFDEAPQRTIKENCNTLKFDMSEFE